MNAVLAQTRYLTFRVDGALYALPAEEVCEVIHPPPMVRVPQGPAALLGVANLRGTVLPVASLHVMLGKPAPAGAAGSAIVLDVGEPVAMVVDAVASLQSPQAGEEPVPGAAQEDDTVPLRGVFRIAGTDHVASVLDIRALLHRAFARRARSTARNLPGAATLRTRDIAQPSAAARRLVSFDVCGQEFALPLEDVQEILPAPESVTQMVRSDAAVLGVTAVRDQLLPLLSLRVLLGFTASAGTAERPKVVVVKVGDARIGLVADRTRAILAADGGSVDPLPPVLAARTGGESRIHSVFRAEGGRRLVSILAPDRLLQKEIMQQLKSHPAKAAASTTPRPERGADPELIFLVFRLGGDEFALPIDTVVEVADVPAQITRVPRTPRFLEGVVNLRGEVLPVVDQRRRFEMPPADPAATRRLVVVRTARHRAGLIVDSVNDVLRTTAAQVAPPPELTDATARLVHGVLNLEARGRLVLLLDPAELLTRAEQGLLDTFKAGKKADA